MAECSENHSSYWERRRGSSLSLFMVYQGAEEDADQFLLIDKLLQAVLAEAQVVCVGQPMLIAGDLNADPAIIPCLAKGISASLYVDLALAYSRGAGLTPDAACRFRREEGTGSRRDFFVGGSPFIFLYLLASVLMLGRPMLLAWLFVILSVLLVGSILLISSPRRLLMLFRMSGMFAAMSLGWLLMM